MTLAQYLALDLQLWNAWATTSNATNDPEELYDLSEQYVKDKENLLKQAGGHPNSPRPKTRPHT